MEYHAFGIISEGRHSPYHYMVCGVQGDFTKSLVANPPTKIWTRELKFGMSCLRGISWYRLYWHCVAGIGHASAMFKRGIRVCTGTGIGAALSTCIQSKNWYEYLNTLPTPTYTNSHPRFLIWIGSDQLSTFGTTISRLIHDNIEPDRMILWDTKERGGRPDTMQLLRDTWNSFGAEVIFITSNMKGNDEMMQGCREGSYNSILGVSWVSLIDDDWYRGDARFRHTLGLLSFVSVKPTCSATLMHFNALTLIMSLMFSQFEWHSSSTVFSFVPSLKFVGRFLGWYSLEFEM